MTEARRAGLQTLIAAALVAATALPGATADPAVAAEPTTATMQVTWTRPGTAGTLAPPSALRVGDRVTISYLTSGFTEVGCGASFMRDEVTAWMAVGQARASVDGVGQCTAWTFVLPPADPGPLRVMGAVGGLDTDGQDVSFDMAEVLLTLQAGGTHRPFETNYPVSSWAAIDVFGTSTLNTSVPMVIPAPAGFTRNCSYSLEGEFATMNARPLDSATCPDWEVTVPDPRPPAYFGTPFERPWVPRLRIGGQGTDAATGATTTGDTIIPEVVFEGDGGDAFASNLPTGFAPESTHPRFVLTGSTITVAPEFVNLDAEGECEMHYDGPITPGDGIQQRVPFEDGGCEPVSFVATEQGNYRGAATVYIDGEYAASTSFQVFVIDPLAPPSIETEVPVKDVPFEVSSAVATGLPSDVEITLTGGGGTGASVASPGVAGSSSSVCASQALDFFKEQRLAAGDCRTSEAGTHRVTVEFTDVTGATRTRTRTITVLAYRDIVGNKFALDITWLAVEGITSGCTSTSFCPDGLVTRGQMATFLTRALNLPATSRDYFTDDEGSTHEANINRLRAAGITAGCGGTRFCPNGVVTRAQMATFLVRAFDLPATSTDYFTDDEMNPHEANINRLRGAGVTSGCGGTRYCPTGSVTRGQMAAFLHRAMD